MSNTIHIPLEQVSEGITNKKKGEIKLKKNMLRRMLSIIMAVAVIATLFLGILVGRPMTVFAKVGLATDIGWPTFVNLDPTVLDPGVPLDPTISIRQAIFDKDAATGDGTSYYIDRVLNRVGTSYAGGNSVLTRGRSIFATRNSVPTALGWSSRVVWLDSGNRFQPLNVVTFRDGTSTISFKEQSASRNNNPSFWSSQYTTTDATYANVTINARKFISYNNVAVVILDIVNNGETDVENINFNITSASTTDPGELPNGQPELTGVKAVRAKLTTLYPRTTADLNGKACTLSDITLTTPTISIQAGGKAQLKVVTSITTNEIPESTEDYLYYATASAEEGFKTHVQQYHKWYTDTIPYIDIPNKDIQKAIEYRWWLENYNTFNGNIPGYDFQYPATMEGVLGYNNVIVLTEPMRLQDTKWMRSAYLPYGQLLNLGNVSMSSAFLDNPGKIANWNNHYGQYIGQSGFEAYQVLGGDPAIAEAFAYYFEMDAKGQLLHYGQNLPVPGRPTDADNNYGNAYLIAYRSNYMTGNDADTIDMSYPGAGTFKVRAAESAYMYAAADAASKLYEFVGNTAKAAETRTLANKIQQDLLDLTWCEQDNTFKTLAINPTDYFVVTNPNQPRLIPWKTNNHYNPFSTYAVPTDEASVEKYGKMLEFFKYADEYPMFPCYTANQFDQKLYGGGTNNFSNINFTLQARAYESAIRTYDPKHEYITPEMLSMLIAWQAFEVFPVVSGSGDTRYPNNNEYFYRFNPDTKSYRRSSIHHDTLGNFNYLFFEAMAGIRPRMDDIIELAPIDFNPVDMNLPNAADFRYDHFMVNNFKYHGSDLTIVWDDPANAVPSYDAPQGYSLYVDGERVFTIDRLAHVEYDTKTGELTVVDQPAYTVETTFSKNELVNNDLLTASSSVTNNTEEQKDVLAIFALYDADDRMVNVSYLSKAVAPDATENFNTDLLLPADVTDYSVKAFVWGGTDISNSDMIPLSHVKTLGDNAESSLQDVCVLYLKSGNLAHFLQSPEVDLRNDINPETAANFKKSGIDLDLNLTNRNNLTLIPGTEVSASYTATARAATWFEKHRADRTNELSKAVNEEPPSPDAVIDGTTVGQPFWGTDASPNATDWLQITFPSAQTFNNVKLFFYNDRDGFGAGVEGQGYAEPMRYAIQYLDNGNWVSVTNNNKTPLIPAANFNDSLFDRVTSTDVRVVIQKNGNHPVAIAEAQVFNSPIDASEVFNQAPKVSASVGAKGNLTTELIGTYVDDGLPALPVMPTFQWTVVSAPTDAFYYLSDANTMLAFLVGDTAGDYMVKFEASDGEYTVEKVISVNLVKSLADVAPSASTSASYTASWENVNGPNNVDFEPTSSRPGTGKGWGNWNAGAPAWFQYTWVEPVYISSCSLYWYDDRGGTRVPSEWTIQYSNDGTTWTNVDIDPTTPYSDGVAKNVYNNFKFAPITTGYLRVNITAITNNQSTGILRWKVYGPLIDKAADLHIMTPTGIVPTLPSNLPIIFDTGAIMNFPVTWTNITPESVSDENTFVVTGIALGILAKANIYVRTDADIAQITDIWPMSTSTAIGTAPTYPEYADVSYNNGGRTNTVVPVTWNAADQAAVDFNTVGSYTVKGTIQKGEEIVEVILTVTVK